MGVAYGINPTWAAQTDAGRIHIATKGVVQDGLVLNLDAGASTSYPGSGTTWTDLSGNGANATLNNLTYSSINGGTIVFDGVANDYAEVGNSNIRTFGTGDFAIESWFYLTGAAGLTPSGNVRPANIFANCSLTNINTTGCMFYILGNSTTTGTGLAIYRNTPGVVSITRTVSISQLAWHHAVVTRIGTDLNFYLDGFQLDSPTTDSTSWGNASVSSRVGYWTNNGSWYHAFPGYIPITRIYKGKGLTASEVSQNFNALRARFGI